MKTWSEFYLNSTEDNVRKRLSEMPLRIGDWGKTKQKAWSQESLQSLWDIASNEKQTKVGSIKGEQLIKVGHNAVRYYFLLKDGEPTFVVSLTTRKDIFLPKTWQVDIAAKTSSSVSLEDFYKYLVNKEGVWLMTGTEQSTGAEKVWKTILSKPSTKYTIIDDGTGEPLDIELKDAWGKHAKHSAISIIVRKM